MPVFNSGKYVQDAIGSILQQSFGDFELIVIDDGSTDDSLEIISSFDDKRIRLLQNERNMGIVYSRNRGLEIATGTFYAPFDADDIALPGKFHKQISFLNRHPGFGMVGCHAYHIDSRGKRLPSKWKLSASPGQIPPILLFRNYFVHSAVVLRRSAIPGQGYLPGFEYGEDYAMWSMIDRKWKMWNIPEYLLAYRIDENRNVQYGQTEIRRCETMVTREQFSKLKIHMTDRQIDLLSGIRDSRLQYDKLQRREIKQLFLLILRQNRVLKIYNHLNLIKVLANRWLKVRVKSLEFMKA